MARQVREDLSYFTLDCDIFSRKSTLRPLLRKFKADGLAVFIHILCDVYGTGYYFKPDDYEGYLLDIAEDCGISVEKVQLILTFMTDRTLLDAFNLVENTVFTSHGIQKRYAQAMKFRKRSIAEIKGDYWLLNENEEAKIDTFYKSQPNSNKSEINDDKSEINDDKSEINTTNKIKENESKLNNQKEDNQKEDYDIEVSKKVSNKKERESYDQIFEDLDVSRTLKNAYIDFISHLKVNFNIVMLNARLISLIIGMDIKYGKDTTAKISEIRQAIAKGYKRLECEERL